MASTIKIAILANAAKARAEMASVGQSASKLGGALKTGLVGAAAAAGAGLAVMATQAVAGARESAQIHRVLESQIRAMGGESAKAFGGATKFAEDYGKAIGKDDDDILKVVNKLSTFPAAFGKGALGAEAMRRATQAAFDLEAAGVGAAESNIIGIGKALDNPIKGMSALSKSGVSFTDQQKTQIENYMKQGKLAEAQKVLLAGIETNAKGAAAQQADGLTRAKVALDGFAEGLASKALPYLDKFGSWFTDTGLPALEKFGGVVGPIFSRVGDVFSTLVGAAKELFAGLTMTPDVAASIGAPLEGLVSIGARIRAAFEQLQPKLMAVWAAIQTNLVPAIQEFITAATPVVVWLVNVLGPVVVKVWGVVITVIQAAVQIIAGILKVFTGILTGNWSKAWQGIKDILGGAWKAITAVLGAALSLMASVLKAGISKAIALVKGIPGAIKNIFSGAGGWLAGAARDIIDGFIGGLESGYRRVRDSLNKLTGMLPDWKGPASRDRTLLKGAGQLVIRGFRAGLEGEYGGVRKSLTGFTDSLSIKPKIGASIVGSGAGAVVSVNVGFDGRAGGSGDAFVDWLYEELRKRIRIQGGNVQAAMGRA